MLIQTLVADLKAPVDPTKSSGLRFWAKVILKATVAPSIHVVVASWSKAASVCQIRRVARRTR